MGKKRDKILPRMIGFNRPIMTYLRIFARIQGYLARRQGYPARLALLDGLISIKKHELC